MSEHFDELVKLVQEGRKMKDEDRAVPADCAFDLWLHNVTEYLLKKFSAQLALEWQAMPDSPLVYGGHYYEDERTWARFHSIIRQRIEWLGKLQLGSSPTKESIAPFARTGELDPDLRDRCLPLVKANPDDRKVWDSAVRTAGVVLEERLRTVGNIKDHSVGRDLVNKVFGKAGTLAKDFTDESERDGYRDLFAGVVGAFRNPSAHRLIDPNPEEGGAYIVFVNLLLKHLGRFAGAGPTTREIFLAACSSDARVFFAEVLDEAATLKLQVSFGGKGFSLRVAQQPAFFFCFPPGVNGWAASRIEVYLADIRNPALQTTMRNRFLQVDGAEPGGNYTIRLPVIAATIDNAKALFRKALEFMEEQRLLALAATL
jgi:Protein of unknown function (Hypoth_ymh)